VDAGPVAPFDAAIAVLAVGAIVIAFTWTENYGQVQKLRTYCRNRAWGGTHHAAISFA
jgi:hypothetical protein